MNKIHSLLELENQMSSDFAWRKKELYSLKSIVYNNRNTPDRDLHIRGAVTLLYAHWEGFIKQVGAFYLNFVAHQRLQHDMLAANFLAMATGSLIDNAFASQKFPYKLAIIDFFRSKSAERSKLKWRGGVNTKSNLTSSVLHDILISLGLDYSLFQTKEKLIDEKLVNNRNKIAHGQHLQVNINEYFNLHQEVLSMMQNFYEQIGDAAGKGKFKRSTDGNTNHLATTPS